MFNNVVILGVNKVVGFSFAYQCATGTNHATVNRGHFNTSCKITTTNVSHVKAKWRKRQCTSFSTVLLQEDAGNT